jgi:hypothetical protein
MTREQVRRALDIPARHFLERGFSPDVLDAFDVGYSARCKRVVVPFYDDAGRFCIGYTMRSYKPPCDACRKHHYPREDCRWGQQKWGIMAGFPKRTYLYNYAAALRTTDPRVFLVEGPPDVWRLAEAGYVGVALLGSILTEEQREKLAALGKHITVAMDDDEPGRAATERLRRDLAGLRCDFFPVPRPYKDFGDTPVAILREAIGRR